MNKNSNLKNLKFIYKREIFKLAYKIYLLQMPSFLGSNALPLALKKSKLLHYPLMVLFTIFVVCNIPDKVKRSNGLTT